MHLVRDQSSVDHIQKSFLDVKLVDLMAASGVLTDPVANDFLILPFCSLQVLNLVKVVISANVNVTAVLAFIANDIRDHKDQAWFDTFLSFLRELLASDQLKQVGLYLLSL